MENNQQQANDVMEIDLLELMQVLWSKAVIIVLVAFMTAVAVFLVEFLAITPKYTSTTKMLVLAKQNQTGLTSSDLTMSSQLTKDYVELIQTRKVTEQVIARLNLKNSDGEPMTHEQLLSKMTVTQVTDTRILTIQVEDPDPYLAQSIADAIRDIAAVHIKEVTDVEAVNTVDPANLPTKTSSPSLLRDTAIGGVVGFVLICGLILALHLMDNTIKTSDDVERYLGISTLGTIPMETSTAQAQSSRKKSRRRSSSSYPGRYSTNLSGGRT